MTVQEAIGRLQVHIRIHKIGEYPHVKLKDALDMAIAALIEKEERDNPEPLTLLEVRKITDDPVWIRLIDSNEGFWVLRSDWIDVRIPEPMILFHMNWYAHSDYGNTWIAYRSKPKEG